MEISPLIWVTLFTFALLFIAARRHGRLHRAWTLLQQHHSNHHLRHRGHCHHRDFDSRSWISSGDSRSHRHDGHHSTLLAWSAHSKLHQSREICKVNIQDSIQRLLQRLESKVRPTPRQQSDWQALKLALLREADCLNDIGEKQLLGSKTITAPARMELQASIKLMENESLQRMQAPLLRYYLMLDDRQRLAFDRTFRWPTSL